MLKYLNKIKINENKDTIYELYHKYENICSTCGRRFSDKKLLGKFILKFRYYYIKTGKNIYKFT